MVTISISYFSLPIIYAILTTATTSQEAPRLGEGKGSRSINEPKTQRGAISKDWYKCDFESGYCGWRNDTMAEFEWYRTSQQTPTTETGPRWDHTRAGVTGAGYYLYIETSVPRKNGDRARLISPILWEKGPFCFTFWHNMHGSDIKDLNVILRSRKSRRETTVSHLAGPWSVGSKHIKDDDRDWWNHESVDITVNEPIEIIIEGISGKNYKGDIAIDDIILQEGTCPRQQANCDFENNTCGWTQMAEDEFNWLPNRGDTQTLKTGPSFDHTMKTDRGRYLYIETSWPRVEGDKARLLSPKMLCDKGASAVFNFWYHMNGAHTGPLKVYVTNDKGRLGSAAWEKIGNQGNKWFLGQVKISASISSRGSFYVIIEAERENFEGDIAIDDLSMVGCRSDEAGFGNPGVLTTTIPATTRSTTKATTQAGTNFNLPPSLPDNINCDFEQMELCDWEQITSDDTDWTLHKSRTPSSHTGPSSDHTTGTGSYMYFEASSPRKTGHTAVLRSRPINPRIQTCVTFYYHMKGKTMGSLEVLTVRRGAIRAKRRWIKEKQQSRNDTDWKYGQVTIQESQPYRLLFRATRGNGFNSDIALDDIKVYPNPCVNESSSQANGENVGPTPTGKSKSDQHAAACDFGMNSTCRWTQNVSPNDDFDWTVATSKTKISPYTGPKADHTSGSRGNYIYIDASVPNKKQGDIAKITSASFDVDKPKCFRFWYHMFGPGIGNLTVYRKIKTKLILLWRNGGERGNDWFEGMIDLEASKGVELVVEATRGPGWKGDIALDDFSVTDGKCPTTDCDFEVDNCGWVQEGDDQFNWTRHSGTTPSKNTGPSHDHTLKDKSGTYLYIEASKKQRYDKAQIRSPVIDPKFSQGKCLTFWYHSFGENVGSIEIHTIQPNTNKTYFGSSLWVNAKNQGNQWIYATVNIRETLPYQILIQGTIGLDYLGDVAIDDIHLKDGPCDTCCGNNNFRCGNNFCIHKSQRCNNIDDCGDESDESFCKNGIQPECGMSSNMPSVREPEETDDNIQRDEAWFETLVIPQELAPPTIATNDTWEGALEIPFSQASRLKHPHLVANRPKIPISIGFYAEDRNFNILAGTSERLSDRRKKRSTGHYDDDEDDDDWVDVLSIQEKVPSKMEKEFLTLSELKYVETKMEAMRQFGHRHKISDNDWRFMRGKEKKSKNTMRMKRSVKKIIGGNRASKLNYPWQAAYYITDSSTNSHFFCGGTLFNRYWVLTAAHCPYLGDLHNIVLGDYDLYSDEGYEQEMLVDAIFLRNKFKLTEEMVGDIALIKLRYPAKQSKAVQLACLLKDEQEPFQTGHPCVTTGWGRRNPDTPGIERYLRQAEMRIIENSHCKAAFWSSFKIHDSYICAGGNGANSCKGDSGGPLVCRDSDDGRFYLAGITSWGDAKCTGSIPGVFTRVQSYNEWIERIMKKHGVCGSAQ